MKKILFIVCVMALLLAIGCQSNEVSKDTAPANTGQVETTAKVVVPSTPSGEAEITVKVLDDIPDVEDGQVETTAKVIE